MPTQTLIWPKQEKRIAKAILPLDNPDLSMFTAEERDTIYLKAVEEAYEHSMPRNVGDGIKRGIYFLKKIESEHYKNIAKNHLLFDIEEKPKDVQEEIYAGLEDIKGLKKLAVSYFNPEKIHCGDDFESMVRILKKARVPMDKDQTKELALSFLLSKNSFAVMGAMNAFEEIGETPNIPEEKLDDVLKRCSSRLTLDEKSCENEIKLIDILSEKYDEIELADIAFDKEYSGTAIFLYKRALGKDKENEHVKNKLREMANKLTENCRIKAAKSIYDLLEEEISYQETYTSFRKIIGKSKKESGFDSMRDFGNYLFISRETPFIISTIIENADDELIKKLADKEAKFLQRRSDRFGEKSKFLYDFVINAYLKLKDKESAVKLIEQATSRGFFNNSDLENFSHLNRAKELIEENKGIYKKKEEERQIQQEEEKLPDIEKILREEENWDSVKKAYEKEGFEGIDRLVLEKVNEIEGDCTAHWSDPVTLYASVIKESENREELNDEEKRKAFEYGLINKTKNGIPYQILGEFMENEEKRKQIPSDLWIKGAIRLLSEEFNPVDVWKAIKMLKIADVEPPKKLYRRLGFDRLEGCTRQNPSGDWEIYDTTDLWSARKYFKEAEDQKMYTFMKNNFDQFLNLSKKELE